MRTVARALIYLVAVTVALAAEPKVKGTVEAPRGWVKRGLPSRDHTITLRIGLPQQNVAALEHHLLEVSDPNHVRYGAHLSKEEVQVLVAPRLESIQAVDGWLASHGIGNDNVVRSPAKDWVTITIPISVAEVMLNTTYNIWVHESGDTIVRTTSYSLPEDLHEHIDVIQPTTMFSRLKGLRSTISWPQIQDGHISPLQNVGSKLVQTAAGPVDSSCTQTVTIRCLQQLYNTIDYVPSAPNNSIAVTGYLEEFANERDLQLFYQEQLPVAVNSGFRVISVNGGINNQSAALAGAEANLDVQFAFGMAFPVPATFYTTAGRPPFLPDARTPNNTNEPYMDWVDFVLSQPEIPRVISTSYGDDEQTVPEDYAKRLCTDFAQLGAMGVSLIFSSGDWGVGDGKNSNSELHQCLSNDGRDTVKFLPLFPASCPYVTAVGGTEGINPEVAVSRFPSGGGFSDYFLRPSYQEQAVQGYLDGLPRGLYEGLFNREGRAFPDVAAQGDRFRIWHSGQAKSIGGTSASAPAFAGIVALLNDVRLLNKQPPLGFLNPFLYSKAALDFNDILSGRNPGCGTAGFNATKGWDPVTGLGTPNFQKLRVRVVQ